MLRRAGLIAATLMLLLGFSSPVFGDDFAGRVECGSSGGQGCDVTASSGSDGSDGTAPETPPQPETEPGDENDSTEPVEAECEVGDNTALCSTTASTSTAGGEEAEEVDVEAVAYEARASLSIAEPQVEMSPSADAPVLVQVPVWMWIPSDDWDSESATASVPGGSVTVTATPSSVSWDMGDGTTVECDGPGTAYNPGVHDPSEPSPDCGHTYTSTGEREVVAQISWEVEWTSTDDEGGTLPALTTESSAQVRVIESSGVVT